MLYRFAFENIKFTNKILHERDDIASFKIFFEFLFLAEFNTFMTKCM